jgi:hypothetical protein
VGKPDNAVDYLAIEVGEWARRYGTVYVPWEIWKSLRPTSQEFVFYIRDQGRFRLEFSVPIRRLKGLP